MNNPKNVRFVMARLKQNVNPIKIEKIIKSLLYSKTDQHDTQNSIINRKDLNPNDITPKQGSYLYNNPKYGILLKVRVRRTIIDSSGSSRLRGMHSIFHNPLSGSITFSTSEHLLSFAFRQCKTHTLSTLGGAIISLYNYYSSGIFFFFAGILKLF